MSDYKKTLNLPQTAFPMKANLAQREPETLKKWDAINSYEAMVEAPAAREPTCCTTALPTPTATFTWVRP